MSEAAARPSLYVAVMDFALSARAEDVCGRMWDFMREQVFPAEPVYEQWRAARGHDNHEHPPVLEDLKAEARKRGLWNLFHHELGGLSNLEYASVAEIMGWSPSIAPEVTNCGAPDTGNMETIMMFGTPEQKERWLQPLLEGEIRSGFAMTEPEVASSDARNIQTSIVRDGDDYVINGRKWWTSGAADERCQIFILMGKTDPGGPPHRQQSMILVPRDTPGIQILRHLPVFGYQDQHGHSEIVFDDVRVPATNLLAGEGDGFMIAQARLGPGRIHHCMRAIGMAERALMLMVERAKSRVAFGRPLAEQGTVREEIARSRMEIDQARLMVLKTADLIDKFGAKGARTEIAAIKVIAPNVALDVIDRAIQVHGGAGVSDDTVLARFYASARTLRIADGPDAVHLRSVAREELQRERPWTGTETGTGTGTSTRTAATAAQS
jgi:acyl-CoA dehydrogenase